MLRKILAIMVMFVLVASCAGADPDTTYPVDNDEARRLKRGKLTGEGGFKLFGGDDEPRGSAGAAGLGINSYLWRATLDTLSFVPLASVDPRGGVIITEWYESPDARGEQFKINVVILDTRLRADGIRVSLFKRELDGAMWRDARVSADIAHELEDKILTRARELRIADKK